MAAKAVAKNLPIAPRKVRLVADLVRDQYVDAALEMLDALPKRAAYLVRKVVASAAANARYQDASLNDSDLYIKEIYVDEGVTRYWIRPRARGMAYRIRRRRSHITVVVDEAREEES